MNAPTFEELALAAARHNASISISVSADGSYYIGAMDYRGEKVICETGPTIDDATAKLNAVRKADDPLDQLRCQAAAAGYNLIPAKP